MYGVRPPRLLRSWLPQAWWSMPSEARTVHLTFDDGPIPEVTPWVLDQLAQHGAQATFFCVGRNAAAHPDILQRIRSAGHAVGNHTWDHVNGWRTPHVSYLRSVMRCQQITGSALFRPPYGRISRRQYAALRGRFRVVMWDVLSADFDTRLGSAQCVRNVLDHVRPGSIIVFHDSLKAWPRLRKALPEVLAGLRAAGYAMHALPDHPITRGSR
jgi:peptidoglycan/xylan/chitin deacetylase (PgdA/CDA1 family)